MICKFYNDYINDHADYRGFKVNKQHLKYDKKDLDDRIDYLLGDKSLSIGNMQIYKFEKNY